MKGDFGWDPKRGFGRIVPVGKQPSIPTVSGMLEGEPRRDAHDPRWIEWD